MNKNLSSSFFIFLFLIGLVLISGCVHSSKMLNNTDMNLAEFNNEAVTCEDSELSKPTIDFTEEGKEANPEEKSCIELGDVKEKDTQEDYRKIPSIWPILDNSGYISSWYGGLRSKGGKGGRSHKGIDIIVPPGSSVVATADGVVKFARRMSGYGNMVVIEHSENLFSVYAHLSSILINEGELVKQGDVIGYSGATGRVTTPHLHYEVRCGERALNPNWFLPARE